MAVVIITRAQTMERVAEQKDENNFIVHLPFCLVRKRTRIIIIILSAPAIIKVGVVVGA